jgi:hypothetical protein
MEKDKSKFSEGVSIVTKILISLLIGKWKFYLIGVSILLMGALIYSINRISYWKKDSERQFQNFQNVNEENKTLSFTVKEWKSLTGQYKNRTDSLFKAEKLKSRQIQEITNIRSTYLDTNRIAAKLGNPVIVRNTDSIKLLMPLLRIPAAVGDGCWGMEGEIETIDPNAKFFILKRSFNNTFDLIVIKPKYFLFFIRVKKTEYRIKTECGESTFTRIDFIKR